MANFLAALGHAVKASLSNQMRANVPHSSLGGSYGASYGGWSNDPNYSPGPYGVYGGGGTSPGATFDYRTAAGDIGQNRVVRVCLENIIQAFGQAPPILEKRNGNNWERVEAHPLIDLLEHPNPNQSGETLWGLLIERMLTVPSGTAYARVVWSRNGQPAQLWFERWVIPIHGTTNFIDSYDLYRESGGKYNLQCAVNIGQGEKIDYNRDACIQFQHAANLWNSRYGTTPLNSQMRQIAGDNLTATRYAAIMRNAPAPSLLVSSDHRPGEHRPDPGIFETLKHKLIQNLTGEEAGSVTTIGVRAKVDKLTFSPDELAMPEMMAYFEASVCAALRVPKQMTGLQSGDEDRTYANAIEARRQFWDNNIRPFQTARGNEIESQLFPLFDLDKAEYRIEWNRKDVPALQEDETALWAQVAQAFSAGVIDLNQAQVRLGFESKKENQGKFGGGGKPGQDDEAPPLDGQRTPPFGAVKSWQEQPRDESGQWVDEKSIEPQALRWAGGAQGFIEGGKTYRVFHGTAEDKAAAIQEQGLSAPEHLAASASWYMVTTDRGEAEKFATGQSGGRRSVVMEYHIPAGDLKKTLWTGQKVTAGDMQHALRGGTLASKYLRAVHPVAEIKRYDPTEARDDQGRWTAGNGSHAWAQRVTQQGFIEATEKEFATVKEQHDKLQEKLNLLELQGFRAYDEAQEIQKAPEPATPEERSRMEARFYHLDREMVRIAAEMEPLETQIKPLAERYVHLKNKLRVAPLVGGILEDREEVLTSKGSRAARSLAPGTIEDAKTRLGITIPKTATNVMLSTDPGADILATYKESHGRQQTRPVYHPDYERRQAEHKFARIAALHHDLPGLMERANAEATSNGPNAHQALTLRLIAKTGLRNGGDAGKGKVEAFGASNLRTEHARVEGDKVLLNFTGKEGVRQRHAFTDPVLARHIEARQAAGHDTIFDSDSGKTLAYLGKISGGKYKVHDLRTYYGTALAAQRVAHITAREGLPKDVKELRVRKLRVGSTVAAHLGNDRDQSLSTYIAPAVFEVWDKAVKA